MKNINYILVLISLVAFTACDFTEVMPKKMVIPTTTKDFAGMVMDPVLGSVVYPLPDVSSDNVLLIEEYVASNIGNSTGKAYFWMKEFYKDDEDDNTWNKCYNALYQMNIVISNIANSTGGTEDEKNRIMAEAKVNRAYYYWALQSAYAPAYDKNSAATDLSVPLALVPDLEAKYTRATVQQVSEAILKDLADAYNDLPTQGSNKYKPRKESLHALLARVYFYMGTYDKAAEEADKALALNNRLNDMNTWSFKDPERPYSGVTNMPLDLDSPESLFHRTSSFSSILSSFAISNDLKNIYNEHDLRLKFYFTSVGRDGKPFEDGSIRYLQPLQYYLGVPEMMLIKAEVLARKGDMTALEIVNALRKKRFASEHYTPLTAKDKNELLTVVLEERRRELPLSGLRWADMKRLGKEGLYTQTLKRTVKDEEHVLAPNSPLYVFPIPPKVRKINPAIVPNIR